MSAKSILKVVEEGLQVGKIFLPQLGLVDAVLQPLINATTPNPTSELIPAPTKTDLTFTDLTNIAVQVQSIIMAGNTKNPDGTPLTDAQKAALNDQKLNAEAMLLSNSLKLYGHVTDKNVIDQAALDAGAKAIMAGIVQVTNALKAPNT